MFEETQWEDVGSSLGDMFLDWEGKVDVRILSNVPLTFKVHFIEKMPYYCIDEGCPYCAAKNTARLRHAAIVYVRAQKAVKILENGPQVFAAIRAIIDQYGHPMQPKQGINRYDITLVKTGSGLNTKYSAIPVMNSTPLTEEDTQIIRDNAFDLRAFYQERVDFQAQKQQSAQAPPATQQFAGFSTTPIQPGAQVPPVTQPTVPAKPAQPTTGQQAPLPNSDFNSLFMPQPGK